MILDERENGDMNPIDWKRQAEQLAEALQIASGYIDTPIGRRRLGLDANGEEIGAIRNALESYKMISECSLKSELQSNIPLRKTCETCIWDDSVDDYCKHPSNESCKKNQWDKWEPNTALVVIKK